MRVQARASGGLKVEAQIRGFTVGTDQPLPAGGEGTAPTPFDLFVASIATCGARELSTEGLSLTAEVHKDPDSGRMLGIDLDLELPHGFPERYRTAILRAVDQCTVKRALETPPPVREPERNEESGE